VFGERERERERERKLGYSIFVAMKIWLVLLFFLLGFSFRYVVSLNSDELAQDDEEWGFEGRETSSRLVGGGIGGEKTGQGSSSSSSSIRNAGEGRRIGSTMASSTTSPSSLGVPGDTKIQFDLEHCFGDSEFTPAGSFSARLRTLPHGRQVCLLPLLCTGWSLGSKHGIDSLALGLVCCNFEASLSCLLAVEMMAFFLEV
jgi:hypothetical protein